jgi:hypothetical protein
MRRVGLAVGTLFVLIGVFWSGRESSHGLGALWEHWWCPVPLVLILVGIIGVLIVERITPTT